MINLCTGCSAAWIWKRRFSRRPVLRPLAPEVDGSNGLACGFFHFCGGLSGLIIDSFADYLILRPDDLALKAASALFKLILAEPAGDPHQQPSPLVAHSRKLFEQ